jgi:hypothetical protein
MFRTLMRQLRAHPAISAKRDEMGMDCPPAL